MGDIFELWLLRLWFDIVKSYSQQIIIQISRDKRSAEFFGLKMRTKYNIPTTVLIKNIRLGNEKTMKVIFHLNYTI